MPLKKLSTLFSRRARFAYLCLMLVSPSTFAACAFNTGVKTGNATFTLSPLTASLNPSDSSPRELGRVTISAASMASAMGTTTSAKLWSGCTGNLIWNPLLASVSGTSPNKSGYISTGIENLYLYLYAGSQTTGDFGPFVTPAPAGGAWSRALSTIALTQPTWTIMGDMVLVLYQTGPIREGGIIPAGPLAELKLSDGLQIMNMSMGAIQVNVSGCQIATTAVKVGLGGVLQREFTGPGTVVRKTPFTIDAQCDSGIFPVMTFSGTTAGSDSSIFSLSAGDNSAQGIGVQVNYADTAVKNNEVVDLNRTTTQGLNSFPFSAQYIQTDSTVVAGKADATITFTLSYK